MTCPQVQAKDLFFLVQANNSYTCSLQWQSQDDLPSSSSMIEEKRKSPTILLNKSLEQGLNLSGS